MVFKRPYPDWPDLLGGFSGVILEKARFTSTDVSKTMTDAIGIFIANIKAPTGNAEKIGITMIGIIGRNTAGTLIFLRRFVM